MKQLVVISGKGGTGKTSIVASFAALADKAIVVDCDVDAADLHLVLEPTLLSREDFSGGTAAVVDATRCSGCGICEDLCRFDAIHIQRSGIAKADPIACEGCSVCAWFCPDKAITMEPQINGEWYHSETRFGPMVHARLGAAAENSGKLVSLVRSEARRKAEAHDLDMVIIDGSPGIGCPVIASVTGADLALIVTEPSLSGIHDLERVLDLAGHFRVPAMVLVNKADINTELSEKLENIASERNIGFAGRIRYDSNVTDAQIARKTVVEYSETGAAADIREAWEQVQTTLNEQTPAGLFNIEKQSEILGRNS